MLEGRGMVKETDMPVKMQLQAMACASQALDAYDVLDCTSIAAHIKKEFDKRYGSGWQCVSGTMRDFSYASQEGSLSVFWKDNPEESMHVGSKVAVYCKSIKFQNP